MNCLERYRSKLISSINTDLRFILRNPEEEPVHDFRVGIKRLTAFYYLLNKIDTNFNARRFMTPNRLLFKSIGNVRDGHIAVQLLGELDQLDSEDSKILINELKTRIRKDYGIFQKIAHSSTPVSIRMPTVKSTGISERAILRHKPLVLNSLLGKILDSSDRMNARQWHKKRILLKRYHHILDAFSLCPGHGSDEVELKQIKILEQLLGDWHDRVVVAESLGSFQGFERQAESAIAIMQQQDRLLLESAKIYLNKLVKWHQNR